MSKASQNIQYVKHEKSGATHLENGNIIDESNITLMVNGEEWLTFMCTPLQLEALGIGFLFNENIIQSINDLAHYEVCKNGIIDIWLHHEAEKPLNWARTSGCTGGITNQLMDKSLQYHGNKIYLTKEKVFRNAELLLDSQEIYREARGVHCSVISDGEQIVHVSEDIGRHNTFDKLAGLYLLADQTLKTLLILTTGRVSSEMMQKAARLQASVVISMTSPTTASIALASKLGVTLIGYARKNSFNVYTNEHLIVNSDYPDQVKVPDHKVQQVVRRT